MSVASREAVSPPQPPGGDGDANIRAALDQLMWFNEQERRSDGRWAVHWPVHIAALSESDGALEAQGSEAFTAYMRDISPAGVGFVHLQPLPSRRVLVTFELPGDVTVSLAVQVTWSRSIGDFGHSSGGVVLEVVNPGRA
jgi:hypothetical protein